MNSDVNTLAFTRQLLLSDQLQNAESRIFLVNQRIKKTVAVQRDVRCQASEVGRRFHVGDDQIVNTDGLLAIVLLVVQVNIFQLADGDVQHVNAREIVAGLFFEIRQDIGAAGFC